MPNLPVRPTGGRRQGQTDRHEGGFLVLTNHPEKGNLIWQ